jgi:hypothetical protein
MKMITAFTEDEESILELAPADAYKYYTHDGVVYYGGLADKCLSELRIKKLYHLQKQLEAFQDEVEAYGKEVFSSSYEGCAMMEEETLCVYTDCGHEYESDQEYFNCEGGYVDD